MASKTRGSIMIVHEKNSSIGYDTVNKCVAVVRTHKNTTFETLITMAIKVLKNPKSKSIDLTKMENALLELAQGLDVDYVSENTPAKSYNNAVKKLKKGVK